MEPRETASNYDKIAYHWAGSSFNRVNGIAQHERALKFITAPGTALDIGCGSSGRLIDLLIAHQFAVEGLDLSPEMLALAKKRHPSVIFHHADICTWEAPRRYDFISAWDSIWHVPLAGQRAVLEKICGALQTDGVLIFTSGGLDGPGEVTNPCLGQPLYTAAPGIPALLRWVEEFGCVCRHLEYDQFPPEMHLYLIVQKLPDGPARA